MIHNQTKHKMWETGGENHYGVSSNDEFILLQVDDGFDQARIKLTVEEAQHIRDLLRLQLLRFGYSAKVTQR